MSNRTRETDVSDKASKPGSDLRRSGEATPVMKGKPQQPSQGEKGDARRRDPNINKNSQAQQDDVRDGMVQQGVAKRKGPEDTDHDTRDASGKEALRHMQPAARGTRHH